MAQIVHPADIETTLTQIWNTFQQTNKMRACLFNVLIYAPQKERIAYLSTVAQRVIEKFPSRVLFLTYDRDATHPHLKTAVSVMTAKAGDSVIACDFIEIAASKQTYPRIPFLILPHILPDLPIYVVYAEDLLAKEPLLETFESLATRMIFDSEASSNLLGFARIAQQKAHDNLEIADLNWARIEGWRRLFASVFKAGDELDLLRQATHLTIEFNALATPALCQVRTQAIYLQSWLSCQLEWTFQSATWRGDALIFSYQTANHIVEIALVAKKAPAFLPGRPIALTIKTAQNISYRFERKADEPHCVVVEKSTPSTCLLPTFFLFEQEASGQSLVSEICHQGNSDHYLKMLASLGSLPETVCCV